MIWATIGAFLSGAAYEFGCVAWVHHSEGDRIPAAVRWSCFNAIVTIAGTEAYLTGWLPRAAFVAGFGTGTALGMLLKRRGRVNAPSLRVLE